MPDDLDLSFIPETFHKDGAPDLSAFGEHYKEVAGRNFDFLPEDYRKDGKPDTEAFRAHYDEIVSDRAQSREAREALPKAADEYAWGLPEDFELPEGFEFPEGMEAKDLVDEKDPDLPALREMMLKHGAPKEMAADLAKLMATREIRNLQRMVEVRDAEKKKLGPEGQSRIDAVERRLKAMLPEAEAHELVGGIVSADGLKAVEALLRTTKPTTSSPNGGIDNSTASIDERIAAGLRARAG